MTAELPRASLPENVRFTLTYLLPSMLRGIAIPLPFWTEAATRFDTGRGVATVERLTERYAGRPVMLRSVGGQTLLVLAADDVRRVLESPVSVYGMNAAEKRRLFSPFAPDALNGSPPDLHAERRPFNEAVLDYGHEPHRLAERFLRVVHEEVAAMLADAGVLDYERSLAAFRRIARRCALGDAAADDTELSEEHSRLRADADWLGLKVWSRRRDARLRASMDERIQRYVAAAEPGTLVSLFASAPKEAETRPNGQVPFWLMALDAVRTAVFNALALLTTDPAAHERALAEIRAADAAHGPGHGRRSRRPCLRARLHARQPFGCGPRQRCSCGSRRPRRSGTARRCRSARRSSSPSPPTIARVGCRMRTGSHRTFGSTARQTPTGR